MNCTNVSEGDRFEPVRCDPWDNADAAADVAPAFVRWVDSDLVVHPEPDFKVFFVVVGLRRAIGSAVEVVGILRTERRRVASTAAAS
jgi:hypothetical protein